MMSEDCSDCTALRFLSNRLGKVTSWARQGVAYITDDLAVVADAVNNPDGIKGMDPESPIALHGSLVDLCKKLQWTWDETMQLRKALDRNTSVHEKESGHKVG